MHSVADALSHQQIDDAAAGRMQIVVNPPRALGREPLQTPTRVRLASPSWLCHSARRLL